MKLRKANLAITVVATLAGVGMVTGRALVDGSEPLDLGPVIDVSGPEAGAVTPSQTVSPPPLSPQGPKTPLPTPPRPTVTVTTTPGATTPPGTVPDATDEEDEPPPASVRPTGGRPVPVPAPPQSSHRPGFPPAEEERDHDTEDGGRGEGHGEGRGDEEEGGDD
ncbi:hypothetical protein GT204_13305 [Streptomyces sp. SID4919]|uniref:hypothetical protein n=1 Tax=unclassified Streptomyces TaxID=2593676 RepID=UPI000823998A|nr:MULTISPECIES: hypothetical protein [unclassified Streptomyces]MYY09863.1 hypothetical protein [Streptomyces sp. SID4919]SCK63417.1 hypothetical protein YW7DRAFT_07153 [Streptomyces sp. AmelKG-E11A]